MERVSRTLMLALCGAAVGAACTRSPSDPRCADLASVSVACAPDGSLLRCHATAVYYCGPGPDVTAQAIWQSSDSAIVAVSADGTARSVGVGDARITAAYPGSVGTQATMRVRVLPGQPPLPLGDIDSFVRAAPACGTNDGVPGVLVTVTTGLNAGRTATTGMGGLYSIPDVVYGPLSLRASKDGYDDATVAGAAGAAPGIPTICITASQK